MNPTRTKRGQHATWTDSTMKLAVKAMLIDHRPKKSVAKQYGIPRKTLQDYVKRASAGDGVEKCHIGWPTTLTNDHGK